MMTGSGVSSRNGIEPSMPGAVGAFGRLASTTESLTASSRLGSLGFTAWMSTPYAAQMFVTSSIAEASRRGCIGSPWNTMSTRRRGGVGGFTRDSSSANAMVSMSVRQRVRSVKPDERTPAASPRRSYNVGRRRGLSFVRAPRRNNYVVGRRTNTSSDTPPLDLRDTTLLKRSSSLRMATFSPRTWAVNR